MELSSALEASLSSLRELDLHGLVPKKILAAATRVKHLFANAGQKPPAQLRLAEAKEDLLAAWGVTGTLEGVSPRVLRLVPFFAFTEAGEADAPVAGRAGFREAYLRWVRDRSRSTTLAALVRMFLKTYPTGQPWAEEWRRALVSDLAACRGPAAARWRDRAERFGLLAEDGPKRFAEALRDAQAPTKLLEEAGLDGELAHAHFLEHSLRWVLSFVAEETRSRGRPQVVAHLLAPLQDGQRRLRFRSLRVELAKALLRPFHNEDPREPGLKDCLDRALLMLLGHPRLEPAHWVGVDEGDRRTMDRWLTAAAFETFMRILDLTADDRWMARRAFWEGYLPREGRPGALVEAWPVLGPKAAMLARTQLELDERAFGTMSPEDRRQSTLIMRIHGPTGDAIVCEWSHKGAARVWSTDEDGAPRLYQRSYRREELRGATTKWVAHDAYGKWEDKVRRLLSDETGAQPRTGAKWKR